MTLKRDVIDKLISEGITKFILIAENVLNFHSSDASYYEEWIEDIQESGGWVVMLDLPAQSQYDFRKTHINRYVELMDYPGWRTAQPNHLFAAIDNILLRRLNND
jgi:MFS superfamily sulfate permease-like transporter